MKEVAVYLSNKEAELFKRFLEYHDLWEKLFEQKDMTLELHLDSQGKIVSGDTHQHFKVIHTCK